jgi:uncharacterized membrane protein
MFSLGVAASKVAAGGLMKLTGRHRNFILAIGLGVVAAAIAYFIDPRFTLEVGVNVFFLAYVAGAVISSGKLSAEFLRKHAGDEDEPAPYLLVVMLVAVAVAVLSFFLVINSSEQHPRVQLWLGISSVVLGWFAVHTMWAFHYAHEYYRAPVGGLDFPGGKEPNGVAFVYFAYVVGMTAQTSDTAVSSNNMRRLVLTHGVFSFFFNTVIVAAAVNVVVALAH